MRTRPLSRPAMSLLALLGLLLPCSSQAGSAWRNIGPAVDRIYTLAVDPMSPSTVYAGTANGLLRTTDGGASWIPINKGLTNPNVTALLIDPRSSTLYAGTENGAFVSHDGGASWTLFLPAVRVSAIVGHPLLQATAYVSTTDAGVFATFHSGPVRVEQRNNGLTSLSVDSLAIDPGSPSTLYAGVFSSYFSSAPGGIFKSTDGGLTWMNAHPLQGTLVPSIAIDPDSPATIYAAQVKPNPFIEGPTLGGVLMSKDGGATWGEVNHGLPLEVSCCPAPVFVLSINAGLPSTLHAGTSQGVYSTSNGGTDWTRD